MSMSALTILVSVAVLWDNVFNAVAAVRSGTGRIGAAGPGVGEARFYVVALGVCGSCWAAVCLDMNKLP